MGKSVGKPVFKLLGGRTKEKIPCYYSKLYRTDLDAMQAEAQKYLDQGFTMFKMRFGYGPAHGTKGVAENLKAVEAVREVIGYDNDLMLECYMGWNARIRQAHAAQAREVPAALGRGAGDRRRHRRLRRTERSSPASRSRAASTSSRCYGFKQLLERKAVSVVQYDTNRVGGITAAHKINAMCEA